MIKQIFYVLLCFAAYSCGSSNDSDCKYGEPEAIFPDTLSTITLHQFMVEGQEGMEQFTTRTGLPVEIYQSGCDAISQEYRFTLNNIPAQPQPKPAAFWTEAASMCFAELSSLGVNAIEFSQYAQAFQQIGGDIQMNEKIELGPGFYLTISGVEMNQEAVLRVQFDSATE